MNRQGEAWTLEEEKELYNRLNKGSTLENIAEEHKRSIGGIKARIKRLNLTDSKGNLIDPLPPYVPYVRHDSEHNLQNNPPLNEDNIKGKSNASSNEYCPANLQKEGEISIRLSNCLQNMGIQDVRDAFQLEQKDFLRKPNFGRKTLKEWQAFKDSIKINETIKTSESENTEFFLTQEVIRSFQKDVAEFLALSTIDFATAKNNPSQLRESIFKLKKHIRSFDTALLSNNFGIEEIENRNDKPYEENGITAQRILSLIEDMIALCIKNERASYIIRGRIGILENSGQMTLQEIADEFDVSRERIRQIETKTLKTLIAHAKKDDNSYNQELRKICEDLFLNNEKDLLDAIIIFCRRFYGGLISKDIISSILFSSLGLFTNRRTALSQIRSKNKQIEQEIRKETSSLLKDDKYLAHWAKIFSQGIYPTRREKFDGFIPQMTGRYREINKNSTGRTGSFYSEKCKREICYESGEEHRLYQIMEKTDKVTWYQEQPISIPYELNEKTYQYRPDLAVITDDSYGTIIEVKPAFNMVQLPTLRKANAAIEWLHEKGLGYILVDSNGRSLRNLSTHHVHESLINKILDLINKNGEVDYSTYKELAKQHQLKTPDFISLMVHNNLTFMPRPFRIWKLPSDLSYTPLLGVKD